MERRDIQQALWFGNNGTEPAQSNTMSGYGNQVGSYVGINPYTGMSVNPVVADRLYADLILRGADSQIALGRKQQEFEFKKELEAVKQQGAREIYEMRKSLEDQKCQMALKRDEALHNRKINREMAQVAIFEDSDGFLCQEIIFPDGKKLYSKPIVNKPNLQMICLYAMDSDDVVAIVGIDGFDDKIILGGKFFDAVGLWKMLQSKGVVIGVCREKKKQIIELIFAYLVDHAKKRKLPSSLGWYQTEQGWMFAAKASQTMLGARKGDYECE